MQQDFDENIAHDSRWEGNSLAKEDLVYIEGKVTEVLAGGHFLIEGPNGMKLNARLAGKLRKRHIRVILGDSVTVGVSPYDPSHGLITYRGRDPRLNQDS